MRRRGVPVSTIAIVENRKPVLDYVKRERSRTDVRPRRLSSLQFDSRERRTIIIIIRNNSHRAIYHPVCPFCTNVSLYREICTISSPRLYATIVSLLRRSFIRTNTHDTSSPRKRLNYYYYYYYYMIVECLLTEHGLPSRDASELMFLVEASSGSLTRRPELRENIFVQRRHKLRHK